MALGHSRQPATTRNREELSELWTLSAGELSAGYRRGDFSPAESVDSCFKRIEAIDPSIGAFRKLCVEDALAEADQLTKGLHSIGDNQPLYGIPVAVKELFDVRSMPGCYGSEVLSSRVSSSDAEAVRRLRAAGAIIIGITRAHEFGWGITTQHKTLGSVRNPWNLGRVPGGSSGGSAAAVAAGMVPIALASDTGGSIRIPASVCGIYGIKPSYGRIPKRGGVSLSPSMDHPGPVARTVQDLESMLRVMSGYDHEDYSTFVEPLPEFAWLNKGLNGIIVGTCPDLQLRRLSIDYQNLFDSALRAVVSGGGSLQQVSISGAEQIRPTFASIQMAEAYCVHAEELQTFPSDEANYGDDVRNRLALAAEVSLREYISAMKERMRIRRQFDSMFNQVDVLITPITAGGPSTTDNPDFVEHFGDTIEFRDLCMDYTVPQDLLGLPACAVPIGFDADGLPVGIQITASAKREDLTLQVALELSKEINLPSKWPL